MENKLTKNGLRIFASAFAQSLSASLAEASGPKLPLEVVDEGTIPTNDSTPIQFKLTVEGALRGECFIEFYEPQVAALLIITWRFLQDSSPPLPKVFASQAWPVMAHLKPRLNRFPASHSEACPFSLWCPLTPRENCMYSCSSAPACSKVSPGSWTKTRGKLPRKEGGSRTT
jgi:hypothetical protein